MGKPRVANLRAACPRHLTYAFRVGVAAVMLVPGSVPADFLLNMTPGVTTTSRQVFDLHMLIFWLCLGIGLLVFGVMAYSIHRHRKSRGAVPATFQQNARLELAWTIVPLLILGGMAVAATRVLVLMDDSSDAALTVKITGYQWRWQYQYLGKDITFFSSLATDRRSISGEQPKGENYLLEVDKPLVLPVGRKIRFIVTANDVIHSWWVPALGWKKDAIPGYINDAWAYIEEPGTYRGQCAELCGRDHAFMPIVVVAMQPEDFADWLTEQQAEQAAASNAAARSWSREELLERGEKVYLSACAACHQVNGKGIPKVFPDLTTSALVAKDLSAHLQVVLHGRPGTAMQAFGGQLSDLETAAVTSYERVRFGGSEAIVQPSRVASARARPSPNTSQGNTQQ